jgi:hypothetical protein
MARRQRDELITASGKKRIADDEQCAGPQSDKRRKGGIDLTAGAGFEYVNFPTNSASGRLHFSDIGFGIRIGGID